MAFEDEIDRRYIEIWRNGKGNHYERSQDRSGLYDDHYRNGGVLLFLFSKKYEVLSNFSLKSITYLHIVDQSDHSSASLNDA